MIPELFRIGPIPIYSYGVLMAAAFLVGWGYSVRRGRRVGIAEKDISDLAFWVFIAGVLGGRFGFLIFEQPALLLRPLEWIQIWKGGLVFYGGFIAGFAAIVIFIRKRKLPAWKLLDVVAPAGSVGYAIGRVGCFLNGCCFGKPVSWGFVFPPSGDALPRHPTQLYETVAGLAVWGFLIAWERKVKKTEGELILLYIALYGAFRFALEFLRDDYRGFRFLGLSIAQMISLAAIAGAATWLAIRRRTVVQAPAA